MKTIGLIGGMSWESTITYYEILNKEIAKALGGFHSAKIMMYNVDFAELEANMSSGNWDGNAKILSDAAKRLEIAGADFIVIATNTMHKLVPQIEKEIRIPILHIADATANCIKRDNIKKVALLGTKFTMTQDFIKNRLIEAGLEVMTPDAQDIELVNDVIFNELCLGKILDSSRKEYQRIITEMKNRGAEGVILGCSKAQGRDEQGGAWLGPNIIEAYTEMHRRGYAASVEVWEGEKLVGGLYGVTLNKAFFGESMFSLVPNASKLALIHLAKAMEKVGGRFIDCQFETPHLSSMGGKHISYDDYIKILQS